MHFNASAQAPIRNERNTAMTLNINKLKMCKKSFLRLFLVKRTINFLKEACSRVTLNGWRYERHPASNYAIIYCCCNSWRGEKKVVTLFSHTLYIFSCALWPCLMLICVNFYVLQHNDTQQQKYTSFALKTPSLHHNTYEKNSALNICSNYT